jgi:glycosyltransferase involved in cell wall biosynthesis
MARPLVSVIVPAYNISPYIAETMESVRAQTYDRWEAIVADDGSTDDTARIAEDIAATDSRFRVLRLVHDGSPGAVRNRALAVAGGDMIAFLDGDNVWEPDKLACQVAALQDSGAGWGFHATRIFGGGRDAPSGLTASRRWRPPRPFHRAMLTGGGVTCSAITVRRDLLARVSPDGDIGRAFDETYMVEDWDLAIRLAFEMEPSYINRPLLRYRARGGGVSGSHDTVFIRKSAAIAKHGDRGADPRLCRRAVARALARRAIGRLFANAPGWRRDLRISCLAPPQGLEDAVLGLLALLPARVARRTYTALLGTQRALRG